MLRPSLNLRWFRISNTPWSNPSSSYYRRFCIGAGPYAVDRCDKSCPYVLVLQPYCLFIGFMIFPSKLRNGSCPRKRRFKGKKVSFVSKSGRKKTFCSWEMSVQVDKKTVHCIDIIPNSGKSKLSNSLVFGPSVTHLTRPHLADTQPDLPSHHPSRAFNLKHAVTKFADSPIYSYDSPRC
jgi:hypothetical protein